MVEVPPASRGPIGLAASRADEWGIGEPQPRARRCPVKGEVDAVLVGLSVDPHLDAIDAALRSRGRSAVRIDADVDFAGGLNLVSRPPAPSRSAHAVLCRTIDVTLPIADHRTRTFVMLAPLAVDEQGRDHAVREATAAARLWLGTLQADRWINDPWLNDRAEVKSIQLIRAAANGLAVPRTLVASDPDRVRTFAEACGGAIIHKSMAHPLVWCQDERAGFLHTTTLTPKDLAGLDQSLRHHALFQERLCATAEYRCTVVGDRVFSARTDRRGSDDVDWRRDLGTSSVEFEAVAPDASILTAVARTVADLGLTFATVDLLETGDGRVYFLEVNPTGAYLWLERTLGLAVTEAIVDALLGQSE